MISAARKSAQANPFIFHDFNDVLEEVVNDLELTQSQIWNLDESGFPTDPIHCRVVTVKGKPGYKITTGSGRENLTTMACVEHDGRVLAPLFIFAGKNFQNTWVGDKALPGTYYGVSENGWVTSELVCRLV